MKKVLSGILAFALIFAAVPLSGISEYLQGWDFGFLAVKSSAASVGDLSFSLSSDGTSYHVSDCNESASGELTIPSTYRGLPVVSISDFAFKDCSKLTSVTIPDSVTTIWINAFSGCSNLTSVTIPNSVTSIGIGAFYGCISLVSIEIPDSVTSIGSNAFKNCSSLTSITIGNSETRIDYDVFYGTAYYNDTANWENGVLYIDECLIKAETSLSGAYTVKDGTRLIAMQAFMDCSKLTSVTIPDGVTSIGNAAFRGCSSLTSVTIPDSVDSISGYAFYDCSSLTSVTIPYSVTSVGDYAFDGTAYYKNTANWENGVLYIDKCLIQAKTSLSGAYTIEDGTICIACKAFYDCSKLTSVTIPYSVTSIGPAAFCGCRRLESVTIPDGVTSINESSFYDCVSLTSLTIPDGLTNVSSNWVFQNCSSSMTIYCGIITSRVKDALGSRKVTSVKSSLNVGESKEINILPGDTVYISFIPTVSGNYCFASEGKSDTYGYICNSSFTSVKSDNNSGEDNNFSMTYSFKAGTLYYLALKYCDTKETGKVTVCLQCDGHNYADWVKESAPTVDSDGSEYRVCAACGNKEYRPIHNFGEWITDTDPACETGGTKHRICSVCEATENGTIDALGHDYSEEWTFDIKPGCETAGSKSHHCSRCESVADVTEVEPTGHSYGEWITDTKPGCETEGTKHRVCSVCPEIEYGKIAPTGHLNVFWTVEKKASCTEKGLKVAYCLNCANKVDTEVIDALGHSYGEWITDIEPGCETDGTKHRICSVCEATENGIIQATGHNYVCLATEDAHPHYEVLECTYCGDVKQGDATYCETCGECNFEFESLDENSLKITAYVGTPVKVVIPAEIAGKAVESIGIAAIKANANITEVDIKNGVSEIGSLAFLNCSNLKKAIIPASVTAIGDMPFYGCAEDFAIYCFRNSYAHRYAVENDIDFVIIDIGAAENTRIDYDNKLIFTDVLGEIDITRLLLFPQTTAVTPVGSANKCLGTGTVISVSENGGEAKEYTMIVNGDLDGDGVSDVLDAVLAERALNGHGELSDAQAYAANNSADTEISIESYQNVVNRALSA